MTQDYPKFPRVLKERRSSLISLKKRKEKKKSILVIRKRIRFKLLQNVRVEYIFEVFSYSRSQKIQVVIGRIRLVIFLRNGLDKHFIQSPSNLAQTLLWSYSSTDIISCMLHDYDTQGRPVSLSVCPQAYLVFLPSRAHSLTKFGTDLALAYPMNPSKHKVVRSVPLPLHSSFCYLPPLPPPLPHPHLNVLELKIFI